MKQQFKCQWVRDLTEMNLIQFCSVHHILLWEKIKGIWPDNWVEVCSNLFIIFSDYSAPSQTEEGILQTPEAAQGASQWLACRIQSLGKNTTLYARALFCMSLLEIFRLSSASVAIFKIKKPKQNKEGSYLLREMVLVMSKARNTVVWLTPAGFSFRGQCMRRQNEQRGGRGKKRSPLWKRGEKSWKRS